jgi:hypothetical protein
VKYFYFGDARIKVTRSITCIERHLGYNGKSEEE